MIWRLIPLLLVAACTRWPDAGQGGAAELRSLPPLAAGADATLHARLGCALDRFGQQRATAEAQGQMTGRFALVALTAHRAQREYEGGLTGDARQSLDLLEQETETLRAALPPALRIAQPDCV
jgi:hypothetical protein